MAQAGRGIAVQPAMIDNNEAAASSSIACDDYSWTFRVSAHGQTADLDASQRSPKMDELIRYLAIDARSKLLAELLWQLVGEEITGIVETFYANTRQSRTGIALDDATIDRLKARQKEHWRSLFSSQFDEPYFKSASMVGIKHYEIGLDVKWYIAGYAIVKTEFQNTIMQAPLSLAIKSSLIATLEKYVAIDMALAISAYSSWLVD